MDVLNARKLPFPAHYRLLDNLLKVKFELVYVRCNHPTLVRGLRDPGLKRPDLALAPFNVSSRRLYTLRPIIRQKDVAKRRAESDKLEPDVEQEAELAWKVLSAEVPRDLG